MTLALALNRQSHGGSRTNYVVFFFSVLLLACLSLVPNASAQRTNELNQKPSATEPLKLKVLVLNIELARIFSDLFSRADLAHFNNVDEFGVDSLYQASIVNAFDLFDGQDISYIFPEGNDFQFLIDNSTYLEVVNFEGETALGISGNAEQEKRLRALMEKNDIDFFLSLNALKFMSMEEQEPEVLSFNTPHEVEFEYDLFDKNLKTLWSGTFNQTGSEAIEAALQGWIYYNFAGKMRKMIKRFYFDGIAEQKDARAAFIAQDKAGKDGFRLGAHLGINYAAGIVGVEISRFISPSIEPRFGVGIDNAGFHLSLGARYHFVNFKSEHKPFLGIAWGYNTGGTIAFNVQDDNLGGTQNPETRYKIAANHKINIQGGVRWRFDNFWLYTGVGFSRTLKSKPIEFVEGSNRDRYRWWSELVNPGGLQVAIIYSGRVF